MVRDGENRAWQRDLARNQFKLGALLSTVQPVEGLALLRRSVDALGMLTTRDPTNLGWQRDLAEARCALGVALIGRQDVASAAHEADAALRVTEALLTKNAADRQAQRISSVAHALRARVFDATAETLRAREAWGQSLDAIAPVARSSSDYQVLEPLALALARTGKNRASADVVRKLDAMGYQGLSLPAPYVARDGGKD